MNTSSHQGEENGSDDAHNGSGEAFSLPLSQEALEALPFSLAIFDRAGFCVAVNSLMEQFYQIPRSAVIGDFNVFTSPFMESYGSLDFCKQAFDGQRVVSPAVHYDFSFPATRKPAPEECWIEMSYFPFHNAAGEVTHVGIMTTDVTVRVEAEQRSVFLEHLVENASDGIVAINTEGQLIYTNPSFRELVDINQDDVRARRQIRDFDRDGSIDARIVQVVETGEWHGQVELKRVDGTAFLVDVAAFLLRDRAGKPNGIGAILRDRSERHAYEQRLHMFEALVENADIGMGLADMVGNYLYANRALRETYGYGDELIGMPIPAMLAPEELEAFRHSFGELFTRGRIRAESTFLCRDGSERPVSVSALLIRNSDGTPLATAAIVRDLSDDRKREAERLDLQQQIITVQEAALRELSTPLIPIADGVVAMPLIGTIDSNRAQMVIETLLTGVAGLHASTTIIDITGVPIVDTQVANALLQAAQAVKLLGAHVILTGIRPEVAQTLVGLGVDLSGISTRSTLQSGVAEALQRSFGRTAESRA